MSVLLGAGRGGSRSVTPGLATGPGASQLAARCERANARQEGGQADHQASTIDALWLDGSVIFTPGPEASGREYVCQVKALFKKLF